VKTRILARFFGKEPANGPSTWYVISEASATATGTDCCSKIGSGAEMAIEVAARELRLIRGVETCIVAFLWGEILS
jgi:hypothetical protein